MSNISDIGVKSTYNFFGTSVRRSSRSAFGRSTCNDVSGHYKRHYFLFWRERAAFQRSAFGRSTAGDDVVATIFISIFRYVLTVLQT